MAATDGDGFARADVPLEDLARTFRSLADDVERLGKAIDEGRRESLARAALDAVLAMGDLGEHEEEEVRGGGRQRYPIRKWMLPPRRKGTA